MQPYLHMERKENFMERFYEFFKLVVYLMNLDREIDLSSITPWKNPGVIGWENEERHNLIKLCLSRFFIWRHLQEDPHFNYYKIEMGSTTKSATQKESTSVLQLN